MELKPEWVAMKAFNKESFQPNRALLQRIWEANRLGQVESVVQPSRGIVNPCRIVNDKFVIRFDLVSEEDEPSRFVGEARAYNLLAGSALPVPQVVKLDLSKTLVPYPYLITSKLPGITIIDSWPALTQAEKASLTFQAGKYLALLHQYSGPCFGRLKNLHTQARFTSWYDFLADFFTYYASEVLNQQLLAPALVARIEAGLVKCKPVLDRVIIPCLVHNDYHFENLLQKDGNLTGIIDFEHALYGDPSLDFLVEDIWEEFCPGSRTLIYAAYQQFRRFDASHCLRVSLYKTLILLDEVVWFTECTNLKEVARVKGELLAELKILENFFN
jgi:aminoglycoside phosphotransferase (APT) family kinase protein